MDPVAELKPLGSIQPLTGIDPYTNFDTPAHATDPRLRHPAQPALEWLRRFTDGGCAGSDLKLA
jgi:hypothetical protein